MNEDEEQAMSVDEWGEWLDEVPDGWQAPRELREPTRIPLTNLIIKMLSSEMIGNDIVELIGKLLAEEAVHSMWCGAVGKRELDVKEFLLLGVKRSEIVRRVYEVWIAFSEKIERHGRRRGTADQERAALVVTLQNSIAEFAQLRA
jgi:hypothetical protein